MMPVLVGVRCGSSGPISFCEAAELPLAPGERVVVSESSGERLGTVVVSPDQLVSTEVPLQPAGRVRRASAADIQRLEPSQETAGARLLRSLGL